MVFALAKLVPSARKKFRLMESAVSGTVKQMIGIPILALLALQVAQHGSCQRILSVFVLTDLYL